MLLTSTTGLGINRGDRMFPQAPSAFGQDERQSRIRILLVDDHVMFRQCLRNIVDGHAYLEVVGEASNGLEAIDAVHHMRPVSS